ncbi:HvfC/BufC family peptide modification chaperone [Vibrio sp. WJH972]
MMNNEFTSILGLIKPASDSESHDLSWINAPSASQAKKRLAVYQNNVAHSLIEAVLETFPVCAQLLGEDYFKALAQEYIQQHPPTSPVLSYLGEHFSQFIADFPPLKSHSYLTEVAYLEYQLLCLTLSQEQSVLDKAELTQILSTHENALDGQWVVADTVSLWNTNYAAGSLYFAHQPESDINLTQLNWKQAETLLFAKQGLWGRCYPISQDLYQIIEKLKDKQSLAQACEGVEEDKLPQLIGQLLELPIFTEIV